MLTGRVRLGLREALDEAEARMTREEPSAADDLLLTDGPEHAVARSSMATDGARGDDGVAANNSRRRADAARAPRPKYEVGDEVEATKNEPKLRKDTDLSPAGLVFFQAAVVVAAHGDGTYRVSIAGKPVELVPEV